VTIPISAEDRVLNVVVKDKESVSSDRMIGRANLVGQQVADGNARSYKYQFPSPSRFAHTFAPTCGLIRSINE
jgi:hypothetical protein